MTASKSDTRPALFQLSLATVPDEVLLHILSYLDVPELLNTSRTTRHLRHLSLDPLLHAARLHHASIALQRSIPSRPPLSELVNHRIYISRNSLVARNLNRNLIKIRLNRLLSSRPPASNLVERGVLPNEYIYGRLAPALISTKRRIEREKIKDVLRRWVEEWMRRGGERASIGTEQSGPDVGILARKFARADIGGRKVGRGDKEAPTRAKVLGLRRFWEGKAIGREGRVEF